MRRARNNFMIILSFLLALGGLMMVSTSYAGAAREIELKDGSVLTGEILSFDGHEYAIHSSSLGDVRISEAQVQSIRSPTVPSGDAVSPSEMFNLQQQMLQNQDVMKLIESLQNDPQFQAILNDPQLMQQIMSGNLPALLEDPRFKSLMDHPTVNQIKAHTRP